MKNSTLAAGVRRLRGLLALQDRHDDSDEQLLHAFTAQHDDSAFAALVRRYGPLVMGVCRRVLHHAQDAEDAFQATFLVLARNAATLRNKNALASWLHGTAYRLALTARRSAARRRKHESRVLSHPQTDPAEELSWRETQTLLDEEIARLPEIYRSVFVLCFLENVSREEAARRLGLKEGTVSSRLTAARKRLSKRLSRRGVELTALLAAPALPTQQASALTLALMAKTVETAVGEGLPATVSAAVAELVRGATAAMMVSKAKIAAFVLLAMTLLTVVTNGALVSWYGRASGPLPDEKPRTPSPKRETTNSVKFQGRVLDPDGKPKGGAKLLLLSEKGKIEPLGTTAADGRFSIAVPKRTRHCHLIAQADGAGMDFVDLGPLNPGKPMELRLVKDNVIRGRVVNTEGEPIAGVRVSVNDVNVYAQNSLESFLIQWQKRPADYALPPGEKYLLRFPAVELLAAVTDADGRFAISGVGGERVAELHLRGAGIASASLWIVNREGFDPKPYNRPVDDAYRLAPKRMNPPAVGKALQGPNVSVVAEKEKPIRGVVVDAINGKGMPNVEVRLDQRHSSIPPRPVLSARTDDQGRYEFHGARKTKTYHFHVDSDSGTGHLDTGIDAADTVGYAPVNVEIRIKKGVIVTGKIIDRATGKSVPGFAQIEILVNNAFAKDYPGGRGSQRKETAADGSFRVVTIPGPVLLMGGYYPPRAEKFDYIDFSKYRPPIADPEYPQYFAKLPGSLSGDVGYLADGGGIGGIQGNSCKVLDLKPGTAVVHQDLFLDRASVLSVKIQDAQGHPVVGVLASDFATHTYIGPLWIERSTCPVYGLEARKPRLLIFYEPKKKLVASRRLQGGEKPPLTVTLGPMASLKGRLPDADGQPLAGVSVNVSYRDRDAEMLHRDIYDAKQIVTDARGAFALDDLIPELKFELSFRRGKGKLERETNAAAAAIEVKPGECYDLGAVKVKRVREEKNSD